MLNLFHLQKEPEEGDFFLVTDGNEVNVNVWRKDVGHLKNSQTHHQNYQNHHNNQNNGRGGYNNRGGFNRGRRGHN